MSSKATQIISSMAKTGAATMGIILILTILFN